MNKKTENVYYNITNKLKLICGDNCEIMYNGSIIDIDTNSIVNWIPKRVGKDYLDIICINSKHRIEFNVRTIEFSDFDIKPPFKYSHGKVYISKFEGLKLGFNHEIEYMEPQLYLKISSYNVKILFGFDFVNEINFEYNENLNYEFFEYVDNFINTIEGNYIIEFSDVIVKCLCYDDIFEAHDYFISQLINKR